MSKEINNLNKPLKDKLDLEKKQDKTDNDLATTDKTIVGAINELFQDVDSGKQLIATAIDDSSITKDSTFQAMGTAITLLHNQITSLTNELAGKVTPVGTAVAGNVLSGKTFINSTGSTITGTMANRGSKTITPSASNQTLGAGYYSGITVNGDADLVAANIVSGKNIFGVLGTYSPATYSITSYTTPNDSTPAGYSVWCNYSKQVATSIFNEYTSPGAPGTGTYYVYVNATYVSNLEIQFVRSDGSIAAQGIISSNGYKIFTLTMPAHMTFTIKKVSGTGAMEYVKSYYILNILS